MRNAHDLLIQQELCRARQEIRRARKMKPVHPPRPNAPTRIERAERRLLCYRAFMQGFSPIQIAMIVNLKFGTTVRAEHVENLIADGFMLEPEASYGTRRDVENQAP